MNWPWRMFGKPDPDVEKALAEAQTRHEEVIAKTNRVLRERSRLDVMRAGALRAEKRMIRR